MPCFDPRTVFQDARHINPDTGKPFTRFLGRLPFSATRSDPQLVRVPCGSCIGCRMDRAYMWMVRASLEARDRPAYFVTVTYKAEDLPRDPLGRGILDLKEAQDWPKRLRYYVGPFRRMICGEYGSLTQRPHMHAIIYPEEPLILRPLRPEETGFKRPPSGVYQCDAVQASWQHGEIRISLASPANIAYTARYTVKKLVDDPSETDPVDLVDPETGELWSIPPRPREFVRASNRPGLGARYLDDPERLASTECSGTISILVGHDRMIRSRLIPTLQREFEQLSPERAAEIRARRRSRAQLISDLKLEQTDRCLEDVLRSEADVLRHRLSSYERPL